MRHAVGYLLAAQRFIHVTVWEIPMGQSVVIMVYLFTVDSWLMQQLVKPHLVDISYAQLQGGEFA